MSKKPNYYSQVIAILQELHKVYPLYNMGRHLATALDEYGDVWGLTDKELLFALNKYKNQLEMDVPHTDDAELDQIIKEGMDLENMFKEEEDNGDNY
jgi:hypothetical protein